MKLRENLEKLKKKEKNLLIFRFQHQLFLL